MNQNNFSLASAGFENPPVNKCSADQITTLTGELICEAAGGAFKRPKGRVPNDVKAWLEANEKSCGWEIAVCTCGKWYHLMDHLAPYHTEMNFCKKCGYENQILH